MYKIKYSTLLAVENFIFAHKNTSNKLYYHPFVKKIHINFRYENSPKFVALAIPSAVNINSIEFTSCIF